MKSSLKASAGQLDLFEYVARAYEASAESALDNDSLYRTVAGRAGFTEEDLSTRIPIGQSGQEHSPLKRKIRWHQQTLKHMGLIEHVDGQRGIWRLTNEGKQRLRRIEPTVALLAFSTDLGICIWGSCQRVFSRLDCPIHLVITSPPYPLRKPRAYGNPSEQDYVDFICQAMEPIVANLAPGGSICLNISNDIFEQGSPSRSLYLERLTLALHDRLGLSLMDRIVWYNGSKPPGPVQWASIKRVHLNVAWEPVLWFTNDPHHVRSCNQRVLEPHTERHLKLIAGGGEQRTVSHSDGAYHIHEGSYGRQTAGRIPRNVITAGHTCPDHKVYRKDAENLGLPPHGAPFPLSLPEFLIKFMSEPGDLVADPFGGKLTTAMAAEKTGRRWITSEWIWEYIRGAAERFRGSAGYWLNPALEGVKGPASG